MNHLTEMLTTPVCKHCDVLVCGGGVAGISAALSAARCGADVLLVEKSFLLGGLATAGLITIYLPLDDGMGHQVSFGIAEELLRLAIRDGMENGEKCNPAVWLNPATVEERRSGQRFEAQFNPNIFAMNCEALLLRAGVRILYGTLVCAVSKRNGKIEHVVIENKSGRSAIAARAVVDATGDADVATLAGAPTVCYTAGNPLSAWYYGYSPDEGAPGVRPMGAADVPDDLLAKGARQKPPLVDERFDGTDGDSLSRMTCLAHAQIYQDMLRKRAGQPDYTVTMLATLPQVRMTRRLRGAYELDISESRVCFPDTIGTIGDWRRRGPAYYIPLRCLYCAEISNLFTAGRCISVTDSMWDLTRVIPACAVTGEAAGVAAACALADEVLDARHVQDILQSRQRLSRNAEEAQTCGTH